jgi:hypothetical protein
LLYGLLLRDILEDTFLTLIEAHFASSCSHITIVSIRHLAGAIDDTSHDTYFKALEMSSSRFDFGYGLL